MRSRAGRSGCRLCRVRLAAAVLAAAVTLLLVGLGSSEAAPAKSTGTILQYDEQGRVIGRVRRQFNTRGEPETTPAEADIQIRPAAAREDTRFVPGEIVAASSDPSFAGRVRSLGFPVLERTRLPALEMTLYRLRTPAGAAASDVLPVFRTAFPGVEADVNAIVRPASGIRGWDAVAAVGWPSRRAGCGNGISIGMIDTAVDPTHEAFGGRDVIHRSFLPPDRDPAAADHGTAVAALLVGDPGSAGFEGLLPGARLYAGSIFEENDTGRAVGNVFALVGAFDWMVASEVDVLNLSLETGRNSILLVALDKALSKGLTITAAAGNGGAAAPPAYPAAHPNVLAVTAIDPDLQAYRRANHGDYIDFAAPGVSLWTATPGGGQFQSGTSFAVPFLTAAVAMQQAAGRTQDADALRLSLSQSVRDLGQPGKDDVFGWGLLSFSPDCR